MQTNTKNGSKMIHVWYFFGLGTRKGPKASKSLTQGPQSAQKHAKRVPKGTKNHSKTTSKAQKNDAQGTLTP